MADTIHIKLPVRVWLRHSEAPRFHQRGEESRVDRPMWQFRARSFAPPEKRLRSG
jgi:hypothetical protein